MHISQIQLRNVVTSFPENEISCIFGNNFQKTAQYWEFSDVYTHILICTLLKRKYTHFIEKCQWFFKKMYILGFWQIFPKKLVIYIDILAVVTLVLICTSLERKYVYFIEKCQ